jgi:4-amino-4-deoxy-L-arabinose transferase-like glycosyltransferase
MIEVEIMSDEARLHPEEVAPASNKASFLILVILFALGLRLLYFTGMSLGDDVFHATQALSMAEAGRWPPGPYHWNTRLGVIIPTVASIKAFGPRPLAIVLWPLLASTTSTLACYLVARDLVGPGAARLAAIFQAAFPLEVIYGTHLYPDVIVALCSTLGIWSWIRALKGGAARDYFATGAWLAAGYLCRERSSWRRRSTWPSGCSWGAPGARGCSGPR